MLINISSGFYHNRQNRFLANLFRIFQLRTWKITFSAVTSVNFHGSFWNVARTFIALTLRRFCFIKYAHNGSFNEQASFGIPGLIFQAKATKFGTKVGLNMLININSVFFIVAKKKCLANFCIFCDFAHGKSMLLFLPRSPLGPSLV